MANKIKADKKSRLDMFLVEKLEGFSRSKIQKLIKDGFVFVNGSPSKANFALNPDDEIYIKPLADDSSTFEAEKLEFEVLYEDKDCFVIEKPAGVVVHPGNDGKHLSGTVANAVMDKVEAGVGEEMRPGLVHRLDKDTSGILVVAKTQKGYDSLVKQFKGRSVLKSYLALVGGELQFPVGKIDSPIGRDGMERKKMAISDEVSGKPAVSKYKQVKRFVLDGGRIVNLVQVQILTGRTHQIRVHMAAMGNPVVGDVLYGSRTLNAIFKEKFGLERQFLHAEYLVFKSPETGKEIKIKSPLPGDLESVLDALED